MRASGSERRAKVFTDSSVLIAAVLSSSGGSFRLCREAHLCRIHLITNRYVRREVTEVLDRKYPAVLPRFRALLRWAEIEIQRDPAAHRTATYFSLIHPEDAAVLAGAIAGHAAFLVTLDRRDFFTTRLAATDLPVTITTPKEFFERHWKP